MIKYLEGSVGGSQVGGHGVTWYSVLLVELVFGAYSMQHRTSSFPQCHISRTWR